MRNVIMIGCDLHDGSMLLKIAMGRQMPEMQLVKKHPQREGIHGRLPQK